MSAQVSLDDPGLPLLLELDDSAFDLWRAAAPSIPARIGEYELVVSIGRGGMGEVFLARHGVSGRRVAIKVLRPALVSDEHAVQRFRREAAFASSLRGPHSVRVHAVGVTSNGLPFIVMEYLVGADLQSLLDRGPVSPSDAIRWTRQACTAVAEAHARGVIHRDLKPSNLFLLDTYPDRILKLLDYGIARAAIDAPRLTATHAAVGTPHYMSPEQARNSKAIDQRTDVWSLGVILYELLTGRLPFEGDSPTEIAIQVCTTEPPPPSSLRAGIPSELENIVLWALAKDPADRPADVNELAIALRLVSIPEEPDLPIAPDLPVSEQPARGVQEPQATSTAATSRPPSEPPPPPRVSWLRGRGHMIECVGLVAAAAVVVSLGLLASPLEMDRLSAKPLRDAEAAATTQTGIVPAPPANVTPDTGASSSATPRPAPKEAPSATCPTPGYCSKQ